MGPLAIGWRRCLEGRRTAVSDLKGDESGGSGAGDLNARREKVEPFVRNTQAGADEGRTGILASELLIHGDQASSKLLRPKACVRG